MHSNMVLEYINYNVGRDSHSINVGPCEIIVFTNEVLLLTMNRLRSFC